jgi:hypothetical protein
VRADPPAAVRRRRRPRGPAEARRARRASRAARALAAGRGEGLRSRAAGPRGRTPRPRPETEARPRSPGAEAGPPRPSARPRRPRGRRPRARAGSRRPGPVQAPPDRGGGARRAPRAPRRGPPGGVRRAANARKRPARGGASPPGLRPPRAPPRRVVGGHLLELRQEGGEPLRTVERGERRGDGRAAVHMGRLEGDVPVGEQRVPGRGAAGGDRVELGEEHLVRLRPAGESPQRAGTNGRARAVGGGVYDALQPAPIGDRLAPFVCERDGRRESREVFARRRRDAPRGGR